MTEIARLDHLRLPDCLTVLGDPHVVRKSLDKLERLFDTVEDMGRDVLATGDLLDTKAVIDGYCLNFLHRRLSQSRLRWWLFPGNHDLLDINRPEHSLQVLGSLPNVVLMDRPSECQGVYFVPYIHDKEELNRVLALIPRGAVVFGHFEIKSFDFGNGHVCEDGMPEHSFKKFKRVISGHFHKFAQRGNITYIGTPFSKDFGESNQDKFLGIYDFESDHLKLVPTDFPRHVTITVDADKNSGISLLENNHVRVVLTGSAEGIAAFKRVEGVRFDEKPDEEKAVSVKESEDHYTQYRDWSNEMKRDEGVTALGLELLREASK